MCAKDKRVVRREAGNVMISINITVSLESRESTTRLFIFGALCFGFFPLRCFLSVTALNTKHVRKALNAAGMFYFSVRKRSAGPGKVRMMSAWPHEGWGSDELGRREESESKVSPTFFN